MHRLLVEYGRDNAGIEHNIAAQVVTVGNVVDVAQDFRLRAIALRPMPFLLQVRIERVGIFQTLDVAAAARITIPVPGAADAGTGLVDLAAKTCPAQAMQGI